MIEVGNFPHPVSVDNGGNLGYLLQVTFITWGEKWVGLGPNSRRAIARVRPYLVSPLFPVPRSLFPVPFFSPFPLAIT
jgi:hypothetical protein